MSSFAQIPTELICRFGELTKTEIIVLGYLYAKRNTKTGQCNPSKAAIGRAVGVARPHVSRAVSSLQDAGWLRETEGNFELMEEPKKRTNLVTSERTSSGTPPVPISSHERTNLVTKAYQNEHAYIRKEHTKNIEENIQGNIEPETPSNALALVADEMAIQTVEKAFNIRLDLQTRSLVVQAVPPNLIDRFPAFISGRAVGWANKSPSEKLAKIGYALTDFQKENNGNATTNRPSFQQVREQQAIADRQLIDGIRARVNARKLSGSNASDSGGELRSLVAKSDDG